MGQGGKNGGQEAKGGQGIQGTEGEQLGHRGNGAGTEVWMITALGGKGTEEGHTFMITKEEWGHRR